MFEFGYAIDYIVVWPKAEELSKEFELIDLPIFLKFDGVLAGLC